MPEERVTERFSALVDIHRTVITRPERMLPHTQPTKETTSVKVTVRASTLEGIKAKVQGVLELMDEEDLEETND